jgi:hypothetical protein
MGGTALAQSFPSAPPPLTWHNLVLINGWVAYGRDALARRNG